MFHRVKNVIILDNFVLLVEFEDNTKKYYDVKPLFKKWKVFNELKENNVFKNVKIENQGYAISWNDEIDLSCNELWENGVLESI